MWYDDPPEDRVISIVPGCLANHDRAHSPYNTENEINRENESQVENLYMSVGVMKD